MLGLNDLVLLDLHSFDSGLPLRLILLLYWWKLDMLRLHGLLSRRYFDLRMHHHLVLILHVLSLDCWLPLHFGETTMLKGIVL